MFEEEKLDKGKRLIGVAKVISYLLVLLPAALGFLYVYLFGVNVVAQDSWTIVPIFWDLSSGKLGASDLFAQHAEHRILFPRIAMLSLGVLTEYNSVAEMYLIQSCFLVALTGLFLAFRYSVGPNFTLLVPVAFLPIAFLVFSLKQYENMLTGFQIAFVFVQVFSVLAFCFLYASSDSNRFRRVAFPAALGSATVATFSAVQGLLVWPLGLLQLLVSPIHKPVKRWLVGAWGLAGVGEWTVYFVGYESPPQNPSLSYVLEQPILATKFFLTLLGSSLFGILGGQDFAYVSGQQSSALVSGLVLVCLVAASLLLILKDGNWGEYSFWVVLLLFSFLILASIMVGRSEFGVVQSRYVTFGVLSVISVYAILIKQALEKRSYLTTALLGSMSALIVLSVPFSYVEGAEMGGATKAIREEAAFTLSTYETHPEEFLNEVHLRPRMKIKKKAAQLEELGYNVFSEPRSRVLPPPLSELSRTPSSTPSEIESISGFEVEQGEQPLMVSAEEEPFVRITGWAMDAEDVAGGVYVSIDGRLFPAFYGVEREDLVDRFGIPSYKYSGFKRAIPVSEIGTGTHKLSIVVLSNDEERYHRPDQEVEFEIR